MATVGYGDIVPVTFAGRIIGIIIILTGMGYVSLVTATLAFSFIEIFRKASRKASDKIEKTVETVNTRSIEQQEKMEELLKKMEEIEKKLDEMKDINQK
jgi:voltage-gated potassium channel